MQNPRCGFGEDLHRLHPWPIVRGERVYSRILDQYESENERAWERERMTGCLRAAAASAVCVELVFSDAELWQCYWPTAPFRMDLPVFRRACSMVPTSHQHGSTSETQVPIKRARWNELGSKRRQRQGNALNFDRIESLKRSVVVVEALCLWVFFSEYVTACISLDLSVFHCDCVTVEGDFR